jgi:hypothetical protein
MPNDYIPPEQQRQTATPRTMASRLTGWRRLQAAGHADASVCPFGVNDGTERAVLRAEGVDQSFNTFPQYRRRLSLARFPLVNDGFAEARWSV